MIDYSKHHINLDITDKCILKCPRCMRMTDGDTYKRGSDLSLKDFEKIAKYFREMMSFCGQMSDPIYHPDFLDFIKIYNKYAKRVGIHTNGSGKKADWWEEAFFLTSKPAHTRTKWIFGLDGLPHESNTYRVNQDGNKVFEMMRMGAEMGCEIHWQYIVFKYNENHIDRAKALAEKYNINFHLMYSSRWLGDDPLMPSKMFLERPKQAYRKYWSEFGKFDKDPKSNSNSIKLFPRCIGGKNASNIGTKDVAISATGYFVPCCWCDNANLFRDFPTILNEKFHISNIDSPDDVFKSEEWKKLMYTIEHDGNNAPKVCKVKCGSQWEQKRMVKSEDI